MNDIEIGDYVRDNSGLIGQLIRIERDDIDTSLKWYVIFDGKNEIYINKPYITKHSKNIIDLIEVGDFVNGREVKHIAMFEGFPNYPKLIFVDEKRLIPDDTCKNDEIKTILTKEQYSQNCYAVERS